MNRVGKEFMRAYSRSGKASANTDMAGVTTEYPREKKYRVRMANVAIPPFPPCAVMCKIRPQNVSLEILSMAAVTFS